MTRSGQKEVEICHMTSRAQNETGRYHMTKKSAKAIDRGLVVTDIQGKDVCLIGDYDINSSEETVYDENDNKEIGDEGGTK